MKSGFAKLIRPLVLVAAGGPLMVQASPGDNTMGTVSPSPATTAAPIPPIPAAEAAKTVPVTEAPSAPATPVSPAAAAPAPAAMSQEEEKLAIRKTAHLLGLKPRSKAGTEVYCKSSAEIGTRMPTLNCYTKDEVLQLKKNSQANQDDVSIMQRQSLTEPNRG